MTNEDDEDIIEVDGVRENLDHNIGTATCPKCKDTIAFVYYFESGSDMVFPDGKEFGLESEDHYMCPRCGVELTNSREEAISLLNGKANREVGVKGIEKEPK